MKREPSSEAEMAERLTRTRSAFGVSQKDFAVGAGVNHTQYNNWEKGHRIGLSGALKLCKAYGLSLDWIYFGDPANLPVNVAKSLGFIPLASDHSRSSDNPVSTDAASSGESLMSTS